MYKPQVPYTPQIYKNFQTVFGGYNHTSSCGEGEIYDMKNIGHEEFPVLTPRRGRNTAPAFDNGRIFPAYSETEIVRPKIRGIYSFDDAYVIEQPTCVVDGKLMVFGNSHFKLIKKDLTEDEAPDEDNIYVVAESGTLVYDPTSINKYITFESSRRIGSNPNCFRKIDKMVAGTDKLVKSSLYTGQTWAVVKTIASSLCDVAFSYDFYIFNGTEWELLPDRDAINYNIKNAEFKDGIYYGEDAEANTLYSADSLFGSGVQVGDSLKITGCVKQPLNNKTVVVKGVSESGHKLSFYENTFTLIDGETVTEDSIFIERDAPWLRYLCTCNNRVFGCKGDTIYASKLGDPYNWNVFEGISTDSYSVDVGSPGDFTACCAYGGDVLFFKEERIYKLMYTDNSPENWSLVEIETYGVKAGCENSLAVADSCLFYYSPKGMMRYTGSLPMSINEAFGEQEFVNAVAGSDGKDYYVCLTDKAGESALFVYDTTHFLWFKHDDVKITSFAYHKGDLTALVEKENGDTEVMRIGQKIAEVPIEGEWLDMESTIEFSDAMNDTTNKKLKLNISVTAEVAPKSELRFYVSCDGGSYEFLGKIEGKSNKQTHKFSFVPTRCDYYRLKVEGKGMWKIYAISNGYTPGSDI